MWIWGLGNNVWILLLMFVPVVNIAVWIMLGVKGSEWAWRNKKWESVGIFQQSQKNWNIAGFIAFPLMLMLTILVGVYSSNQPYEEAIRLIQAKKYDDAIGVLKTIQVDDSIAERAKVAIAVCEMGNLYLKKEYAKAQGILMKTEGWNADNDGYYTLNVNRSDPLFPHAATLAHLVMAENMIQY